MTFQEEKKDQFSKLVRYLKDEKGVSYQAIAESAKVKYQTIANAASGRSFGFDTAMLSNLIAAYPELGEKQKLDTSEKKDNLRQEYADKLLEELNIKLQDLQEKYEEMVKNNSRLLGIIEKLMAEK